MGRFVVNRSCHRSSSLPIDHAHEQMNKKIKGVWVSHWSHANSSNIRQIDNCWPRTMQSSEEFEGVQIEFEELPHHQEGMASQR